MMKIRDFIRKEIFGRKLEAHRVLVVYDPARRYREIALGMRAEGTTVVDATESGLLAREEAGAAFRALARSAGRLLVYVPAERPADDTQRQRDPFSVYARFGAEFPHGDGEEYKNLCLRAQPDHPGDVLKLFGNGAEPTLDMVDAIGGGDGWPILRTVLSAGSSKEILRALLFATEDQKDGLKRSEGWTAEAKSLFESVLGFRPKTRAKAWKAIADELWEFLLFSEFAFDLPGDLPPALAPVPRAKDSAKPVVFDLCDEIRNDIRNVSVYVGRAREVQAKFGLESAFRNEEALGERDTFPFEERKYFAQAVAAARLPPMIGSQHSTRCGASSGRTPTPSGATTARTCSSGGSSRRPPNRCEPAPTRSANSPATRPRWTPCWISTNGRSTKSTADSGNTNRRTRRLRRSRRGRTACAGPPATPTAPSRGRRTPSSWNISETRGGRRTGGSPTRTRSTGSSRPCSRKRGGRSP